MRFQTFKLDGVLGVIFTDGWVKWDTLNCHYLSLGDCSLKEAIDTQCNIKSEVI